MLKRIGSLFRYKRILRDLVIRNLKAKYAGSLLGILWAFINPLLLALIISFIFTEIVKVNIKNFYLFVISGILPWFFFASSLQEASISIPANANILKQFFLPREFVPIVSVLTNFIILVFGFLIIIPLFIVFNPKIIFILPLLVSALFLHLLFTIGIALILSSLYVYFKDIGQLLGVLLLFWLWLTPVFYSVDMVPDKYRALFDLNPLTPYIILYRSILFDANSLNLRLILYAFFLSIISLCLGYATFIKQEPNFLKRI